MAEIDAAAKVLIPGVRLLLETHIAKARDEVIRKAVEEFEALLRRDIAMTAVDVSRFYSMEMREDNLVITIKDFKS